ncbi:hypothetical protein CQA66_02320 [Helicobacter aurati]|uniref:Lipoprotein n=1 Tax=Helicobacter aurati TaxID=137778 RepID=A0A3D8J7J8_9HELI|nr:hypothetical protein [Helicobacter aurati]RDU73086.1 hypothetical protein CQA66_02320 [Helicobacter aurati]
MKMLKKLLFVSIATTGLLVACPNMDKHSGDAGNHGVKSAHKSPDGILGDLYENASFKQKREILQIEYDFRKAVKKQTEKFKEYREAVWFDIKNLQIDLEEAKYDRNSSKATAILHRIVKKKEELRKSKQDEKNLHYLLDEDRIKKINEVLKVK